MGGEHDAATADVGHPTVLRGVRAGVLDRPRGTDSDGAAVGGDGRVGVRLRAGQWPTALVVRGGGARRLSSGGAALADGGGDGRFIVVDAGGRCWRRARPRRTPPRAA